MITIERLEGLQDLREGGAKTEIPWREGLTLEDLAPEDWDGCVAWRQDRAVPVAEWETTRIEDGDRISFGRLPGALLPVAGGAAVAAAVGGSGAVAGAAGGAAATGFLAFLGNALLTSIIGGALSLLTGYLIQALSAPKKPSKFKREDEGPTYSWQGIQNTAGPGRPIPRIYGGPVRVGGHFLQSFQLQATGAQVQDGTTTLYDLMSLGLGPLHSISAIEIDGKPVEDLTGVTVFTRRGTFDQGPIPGFYEQRLQLFPAKEIRAEDGPLTFETFGEVDGFEVLFRFAQLFKIPTDTLSTRPADVVFLIRWQAIGGSESGADRKTVSASTRSEFRASFTARNLRRAKYRIVIERETVDDENRPKGGLNYSTASEVYAITEISHQKRAHPGIAMVGLHELPTSQLSGSAPALITALVEGFEECRIYSDVSTYTVGYSNNPAWCAVAYLTDTEGGLGDLFTHDDIDIASFLELAAYCDELVSDGRGGLEKRATCAVVQDTVEPSDELLDWFTDGANASIRFIGGKWVAIIDRGGPPVWSAGEGNIFPETWQLEPVAPFRVANRVLVSYRDSSRGYQRGTHPEELPGLSATEQRITTARDLRSVTRKSHAARVAKRLLAHNKYSTETVAFEAGLSAARIFPGVIFQSSMPSAGIGIASGRLLAVDTSGTQLRIDEEITIEAGKAYEVIVHLAASDASLTKRLVNAPGATAELFVSDENWGGVQPQPGDVYLLGEVGAAAAQWRAANVLLRIDEQGQFRRQIEALRYDPAIDADDLTLPPEALPQSLPDPRGFAPDVSGLVLTERLESAPDGALFHSIHVDFLAPISAIVSHYQVWMREADSVGWVLRGEPTGSHFEVEGRFTVGETLYISVVPVTRAGVRKDPDRGAIGSVTIGGQIVQPPSLAGLVADIVDGTLIASVEALPASALGVGGGYVWRLGVSWEASRLLERTTAPRLERTSFPRGDFVLLAKAVNGYGNESPIAASVAVTLRGQIEENIVLVDNQHSGWPGIKTGLAVEAGTGKLIFDEPERSFLPGYRAPQSIAGPRWGGPGFLPATRRIVISASYETAAITVSGGQLVTARPDVALEWEAIAIGLGTFADADFAFDSAKARVPFSGSEPDKISIRVQVATSSTDASGFGAWRDFQDRAELTMRLVKFRVLIEVYSDAYAVKLTLMRISIDLPDKEVSGNHQALSAASQAVSFTTYGVPSGYFVAVKRLLLTVIGGAAGDTPRVTAESASGFTYEIRNAAGSLTAGTIHFSARGY